MPFGLCNAPATFQRAMDRIFVGEMKEFVIPYLDDIIIFSKTVGEHRIHVEKVLNRIKEVGLSFNKKMQILFGRNKDIRNSNIKGVVKN
jgi:hypothetical protein